jgi:hypothetical protein
MDPMQNLNNAADALNQVAQRAGAFWDQADAQIAQRQAAYDALGANLKGVVNSELNKVFFVDAVAGDDSNAGGSTAPFKTFAAAFNALVPGGNHKIWLKRGQTHVIDASCSVQNVTLEVTSWGDTSEPEAILINSQYTAGSGPSYYSYGIYAPNSQIYFVNMHIKTCLYATDYAQSSWNGMFRQAGKIQYTIFLANCDVTLGDDHFIKGYVAGCFVNLGCYAMTIARDPAAVQTPKLWSSFGTGSLFVYSATRPAGEEWADLITVVRHADGHPANILANVSI